MVVRLYERQGCGLCRETFRQLTRIGLDRPLVVERVDIESDPMFAGLALRIPVVSVGTELLDAAGLDDGSISRWLHVVAPA